MGNDDGPRRLEEDARFNFTLREDGDFLVSEKIFDFALGLVRLLYLHAMNWPRVGTC